MNPVAHTPWTGTPLPRGCERFAARLRAAGIATTIRLNRGMEIGAACGQLAAEHAGQPTPIVVQRRRERLVDRERQGAPRRALRRPGPGRGGGGLTVSGVSVPVPGVDGSRRPAGVLIAASILDTRPRRPRRRDPARGGRRRGPHPPRRHGRPLRPEHHVRLEDDRGRPAGHDAPVRRPPDDRGARPLDRVSSSTPAATRSRSTSRSRRRQVRPALERIREAGRAAGLSVKPGTPLAALDAYRDLLDIVLVMTVEPGFGGQSFMADVADAKLGAARGWLDPAGRVRGPGRRRRTGRDRRGDRARRDGRHRRRVGALPGARHGRRGRAHPRDRRGRPRRDARRLTAACGRSCSG